MRILLTGANGQVGTEFLRLGGLPGEVLAPTRAELDLGDEPSVRRYVRESHPNVIVNAGAYTAVDLAEKEPEACFAVNATAPAALAEEAARLGALLIHYSTDYVFDGSKAGPYVEDDATGPLGVYGASKLKGEQGIAATGAQALVLRTSWVYSTHGKNFLLTMQRLGREREELRVVDDQVGAPTSARAIAAATARLIGTLNGGGDLPAGVYHMTAGGTTSWCGFARAILERTAQREPGRPLARVTAITTDEYPTPAKRPRNSALSNGRFERTFGFRLPPWEEQLDNVMGVAE